MTHSYKPPRVLREWTLDIPSGDIYQLFVLDNLTVCSAVGRYAHSSGSRTCSWAEFLDGSLNDLVGDKMGSGVLGEALAFVRGINAA
jgi:hypothetical protein